MNTTVWIEKNVTIKMNGNRHGLMGANQEMEATVGKCTRMVMAGTDLGARGEDDNFEQKDEVRCRRDHLSN